MSRLDSFIRRLQAQKACLEYAFDRIARVPGPVLELGLGNGRTYDHLREKLPGRQIFVFDRQIAAHPQCVPPASHMILGEVLETFPASLEQVGGPAALIHVDLGTGDLAANAQLMAALAADLVRLLAPGGIIASDRMIPAPELRPLPLPDGVAEGRYHLYERPAT